MKNSVFFSASQKSGNSRVVRLMNDLNVNRVAYFFLRGGTSEQRAYLQSLLGDNVIACLSLRSLRHPRQRRQLWILEAQPSFSLQATVESYRAVLQHIFGEKCRIVVRICWKEDEA